MFGPVFLNGVVTSISVSDVVYNPPLTGSGGISQQTLDSVHYYNPPDAKRDLPWVFENEVKRTETTTFTQSTTTTYGITVNAEVSAELFGIGAKIGDGYSWQRSGTQETSTSTTFVDRVCEYDAAVAVAAASYPYSDPYSHPHPHAFSSRSELGHAEETLRPASGSYLELRGSGSVRCKYEKNRTLGRRESLAVSFFF